MPYSKHRSLLYPDQEVPTLSIIHYVWFASINLLQCENRNSVSPQHWKYCHFLVDIVLVSSLLMSSVLWKCHVTAVMAVFQPTSSLGLFFLLTHNLNNNTDGMM